MGRGHWGRALSGRAIAGAALPRGVLTGAKYGSYMIDIHADGWLVASL